MTAKVPVQVAVASGHRHLGGTYATMTGGAIAALLADERHPGKYTYAYSDVDFFHPSSDALSANIQLMLDQGAVPLNEDESRKLRRWKRYGMGDWDTNSIKLETNDGHEFNLVFKLLDHKPLRTAIEQVGSFDFSHLGGSYNMETGAFHDLTNYYWPGMSKDEIHMFPDREEQWLIGSIGKHQGLRQAGRYAKWQSRGFNLQQFCQKPLVEGYRIVGAHYLGKEDDELQTYGEVYMDLAQLIEVDDIDAILHAYEHLNPYSQVQSLKDALP